MTLLLCLLVCELLLDFRISLLLGLPTPYHLGTTHVGCNPIAVAVGTATVAWCAFVPGCSNLRLSLQAWATCIWPSFIKRLLFPSKVPSYEEGALLLVPAQEDLALLPTTLCTSAVPLLLWAVDSLAIHFLGNIQLPLPSTLSSIDLFVTHVLNANRHPWSWTYKDK